MSTAISIMHSGSMPHEFIVSIHLIAVYVGVFLCWHRSTTLRVFKGSSNLRCSIVQKCTSFLVEI